MEDSGKTGIWSNMLNPGKNAKSRIPGRSLHKNISNMNICCYGLQDKEAMNRRKATETEVHVFFIFGYLLINIALTLNSFLPLSDTYILYIL